MQGIQSVRSRPAAPFRLPCRLRQVALDVLYPRLDVGNRGVGALYDIQDAFSLLVVSIQHRHVFAQLFVPALVVLVAAQFDV